MLANAHCRVAVLSLGLGLLTLASPALAPAAPPGNDNFSNATAITALPFSDEVDSTEATTEPGEPFFFCGSPRTAWYSITPTVRTLIRAEVTGISVGDAFIAPFRSDGPGFAGLTPLDLCAGPGVPRVFVAEPGKTYYIQAGSGFFSTGGLLRVHLEAIPPPANDAFASATSIGALPFSETVEVAAAGLEPGEPEPSCRNPLRSFNRSVWYALTPALDGYVSARIQGGIQSTLAAYTGSTLPGLSEVGCRAFDGGSLLFRVSGGTTYRVQLVPDFDGSLPVTIGFAAIPAPVASYRFSPPDPSVFDTIEFVDESFDPGQVGVQLYSWDFGDGSTSGVCCPTHRFTADGDYTVELTVTTLDGRSASTSRVVSVRTTPTGSTCGEVRGDGRLATNNQTRFVFHHVKVVSDTAAPLGLISFSDLAADPRLRFESTFVTSLVITGSHVRLAGTGIANGLPVDFVVEGDDASPDTFSIVLSNGYSASGAVANGRGVNLKRC